MAKFQSKAAYNKWVAYGHIHGVMNGEGREKITIHGKPHKVVHDTLQKSGHKIVKHK